MKNRPNLNGVPREVAKLIRMGAPIVPRVSVGYPCGGSVTVPWAKSMMGLIAEQMRRPEQARSLQRIIPAQGLYVGRNRNVITRNFLKGGNEEYLLMIDTDIEFQPELLDRMLIAAQGRDIVAANVRLGQHTNAGYEELGELYRPMETLPEGEIIPVDAAATAVMMIHRRVFEKISELGGPCWFVAMPIPMDVAGEPEWEELGEDLAFCKRAKAAGFQTHLVRGLGIRHHKSAALEEQTMGARGFHELAGVNPIEVGRTDRAVFNPEEVH